MPFEEPSKLTFYNDKLLWHRRRLTSHLDAYAIPPITLDVDLTNRCNCQCPGCVGGRGDSRVDMDLDVAMKLLNRAKKLGILSVVFTGGGEPTLHTDLPELLYHAKVIGLKVAVVTNGVLLSEKPRVVKAIIHTCEWVRISLDAGSGELYQKTHGVDCYGKVLSGIKALSRKRTNEKITIGVAFLTGSDTIQDIPNACLMAREAGADYLYLRPFQGDKTFVSLDRYKEQYDTENFKVIGAKAYENVTDKAKPYDTCAFGWWVSVVKADGNVAWCCIMRDNPKYWLGNIHDEDLEVILSKRDRIKVDFKDCIQHCRGDHVNRFLWKCKQKVMHVDFL